MNNRELEQETEEIIEEYVNELFVNELFILCFWYPVWYKKILISSCKIAHKLLYYLIPYSSFALPLLIAADVIVLITLWLLPTIAVLLIIKSCFSTFGGISTKLTFQPVVYYLVSAITFTITWVSFLRYYWLLKQVQVEDTWWNITINATLTAAIITVYFKFVLTVMLA